MALVLIPTSSQRNWDPASAQTPENQRKALIRSFLAQDKIPEEYAPSRYHGLARVPSEEEIRNILTPWRPLQLRKVACFLQMNYSHENIILRTYYGGSAEDDAKLQDWLDIDSESDVFFSEEALWWRMLNDKDLFDFGSEWERVFDILPELAGRQGYGRHVDRELPANYLEEALEDEEPEDQIRYNAFIQGGLFPLLVADKQAFEKDQLRVLYLDAHGNIIMSSNIAPDEMALLKEDASRGIGRGSKWWEFGEVGPKYKADGEIGQLLYPVQNQE